MDVQIDVILYEDHTQFDARIAETSLMLEEFLSLTDGRRWTRRVAGSKVINMSTTCGAGHSLEPGSFNGPSSNAPVSNSSSSDCMACSVGFHKEALDDSPCLKCPGHATTGSTGTNAAGLCICKDGYAASGLKASNALRCVANSQHVSIPDAKAAARAMSTAIGTIIGANVAVAVGTAVGSAVTSAMASSVAVAGGEATTGASASGSTSSGTTALITQACFEFLFI